jgi:hypothetical protein
VINFITLTLSLPQFRLPNFPLWTLHPFGRQFKLFHLTICAVNTTIF